MPNLPRRKRSKRKRRRRDSRISKKSTTVKHYYRMQRKKEGSELGVNVDDDFIRQRGELSMDEYELIVFSAYGSKSVLWICAFPVLISILVSIQISDQTSLHL